MDEPKRHFNTSKYANLEDTCPLCGSRDTTTTGSYEHVDNFIAYPMKCKDCGATWQQWYALTYTDNTDVYDGDGEFVYDYMEE